MEFYLNFPKRNPCTSSMGSFSSITVAFTSVPINIEKENTTKLFRNSFHAYFGKFNKNDTAVTEERKKKASFRFTLEPVSRTH